MAVESPVTNKDMALIEDRYVVPDPAEVRRLLRDRPDVREALLGAPAVIREVFGGRLQGLVLEVVPDWDEGEDLLGATALVRATPQEAFELRGRLDRWWLTKPSAVRLVVALGPVPAPTPEQWDVAGRQCPFGN